MGNALGKNEFSIKTASAFAKIAIAIYAITSLLCLRDAIGGFLYYEIGKHSVSASKVPVDVTIVFATVLLIIAILKFFLTFKLLTRKNWARIVVVIVSTLLAAFLIFVIIYTAIVIPSISFLTLLKNNYGYFAEVVAASLLLLPKSRGCFVSKATNA